MRSKLKLYVWYNVFSDYTPGIAFALAESEEQARELAKQHCESWEWDYLDATPKVYDKPFAYHQWGGG